MHRFYGPQYWWPAETPTEVVVGAILAQNTAWRNVERAIANLKRVGLLDWGRLRDVAPESLAQHIKPAGTYKVKARRLKAFIDWFWQCYGGDLHSMFATPQDTLREELLAVPGIGRETADAILLYAGGLPTFVVDAYTARILFRHGLIDADAGYEQIKELFESSLSSDAALYNEFHALLVRVGKEHCRPRARCQGCPLEVFDHEIEAED
jgi:endonuclease-3 related protein